MKISISGVRGIFGKDLTLDEILRFTRYFSGLAGNSCVLARDTRESSRIISEVSSAALMERGIDVYNLGVAPTPYAFRESRKKDSALIVTASHNPLEWNGLKFVLKGRGIFEDELDRMMSKTEEAELGRFGKEHTLESSYRSDLVNLISTINEKHRIAMDLAGGAAAGYADRILSDLGCTVVSINDEFGVSTRSPDPTSDELQDLKELVRRNKCELGFAFDLDGDRLVLMDSMGTKLRADATLLLCTAKAMEMGMKKFVTSIDTSKAVDDYIKEKGCKVSKSKVGEANVVKEMLANDIPAGGEGSSGGFILKEFNMCRDGMLASVLVSTLLGSKEYDECMKLLSQYHSIRGKISSESPKHSIVIECLGKELEKNSSDVNYMDGVFALVDENTTVLIRGSNTEHSIRLSVESKNKEKSEMLYRKYEAMIREENEKAE